MERRRTLTNGAGVLVLGLSALHCTAALGIDKDYRELGGAGGSGTGGAGAGGATSGTSASSGAGGAGGAVWHSWDIQVQLGNGFVYDTTGHNVAAIVPYQSRSLTDLGVDLALSTLNPNLHPDGFNHVTNFWVPDPASQYPYVGQSAVPRGMDSQEQDAPYPPDVTDLQLYPPADAAKLVVAAFVVPRDSDYTISGLSARRVTGMGNTSALRVFVGDQPVGPAMLVPTNNKVWINDGMTYPLGTLVQGTQINFAVDSLGDNNYDATEIAWTIIAQ